MKIKFYPYDVDYTIDNDGKAIIRIFGRTEDGKKICAIDKSFEPYFYVEPDKNVQSAQHQVEQLKQDDSFVTKTKIVKKKYLGEEITLIQVFTNAPQAVPKLKELADDLPNIINKFETDILFARRYLIDKNIIPTTLCIIEGEEIKEDYHVDAVIEIKSIKNDASKPFETPKILAFDIETYTKPGSYSNTRYDPIISLAVYGKNYKKVITWKKFDTEDLDYLFVQNETELIQKFAQIINTYMPDYITGYFTDGFDFPYIRDRAKKLNITWDIGADKSAVNFSKHGIKESRIHGIAHLDLTRFIRIIMGDTLETDSYSLDNVSKELLGDQKLEMDFNKIAAAWDTGRGIKEICDYNLHDAELTYKLCEKILPTISEIVQLVGQPIHDVCRMTFGQIIEWYLIRKSITQKEVIPNKPIFSEIAGRKENTYQGAYVFEPKPGLYENIVVFDFRSLYPTLIISHNIDKSTLTTIQENSFVTPEIEDDGFKKQFCFTKKKIGFIPEVLKEIILKRNEIKKEIKNLQKKDVILEAKSYALKIIANSAYGMFGFFGARWYSVECAAAITAWGREYVQKTAKSAQEENFGFIGGDTDSIILTLQDKTKNDALNFMKKINKTLPEMMELELEDFYKRGIFVAKKGDKKGAKKKYALINEKEILKIKGFETVRRDWSKLARKLQKEVLKILLLENNPNKAKDYVIETINKLKHKEIQVEDIVIKTQLRKDISKYESIGPHVKVAQRMKQKGIPVNTGAVIEYVVTSGKGTIGNRARLPEECQEKDYDTNYYINNQIIPAVQMIFDAINLNIKELTQEKGQSKLDQFFN